MPRRQGATAAPRTGRDRGADKSAIMCGRFTLRASIEVIAEHLRRVLPLAEISTPSASPGAKATDSPGPLFAAVARTGPAHTPRYNIAPTQPVIVVRWRGDGRQHHVGEGRAELFFARWGLRPSWAGDRFLRNPLINARAETACTKPAFRGAFRHRRCLIPADGFFEWRKDGRQSSPHFVHRRDDGLFVFAGLWEEDSPPGAPAEPTCTILTTEAPDWLQPLHHRMPVILRPSDYATWLNPQAEPQFLRTLLEPTGDEEYEYYRVGAAVNSARCDQPDCIKPIEAEP